MLRITVCGPMTVQGAGGSLTAGELGGVKPRQLLLMLAVELGRPVPKDMLAERLWDGCPPASYITTLESYVCLLRRRLTTIGAERSVLVTTRGGYALDPARVEVDLVGARAMLETARPVEVLAAARSIVTTALLCEEPYAPWAERIREAVRQEVAAACADAAGTANHDRVPLTARRLARLALASDPTSEPAARALMRAAWRAGDRGAAFGAYADLRTAMLDAYGVEPARATRRLYLAMLRADCVTSAASDDQELRSLLRLLGQALETTGRLPGRAVAARRLLEVGATLLAPAV